MWLVVLVWCDSVWTWSFGLCVSCVGFGWLLFVLGFSGWMVLVLFVGIVVVW